MRPNARSDLIVDSSSSAFQWETRLGSRKATSNRPQSSGGTSLVFGCRRTRVPVPSPPCTTWVSSWASSRRPAVVSGASAPVANVMWLPTVNAFADSWPAARPAAPPGVHADAVEGGAEAGLGPGAGRRREGLAGTGRGGVAAAPDHSGAPGGPPYARVVRSGSGVARRRAGTRGHPLGDRRGLHLVRIVGGTDLRLLAPGLLPLERGGERPAPTPCHGRVRAESCRVMAVAGRRQSGSSGLTSRGSGSGTRRRSGRWRRPARG